MSSPAERIPVALQARYNEILVLINAVCAQHLNDECRDLCGRMTASLCRKRPSPLTNGPARSWACGIAYAVGRVNFLFDKQQTPHLRADELCGSFLVSPKTGSAKAREILTLLKIGQMDPHWTLPSKLTSNPMAWMLEVDGYIVDARRLPLEVQEEALRHGLIPFMPP